MLSSSKINTNFSELLNSRKYFNPTRGYVSLGKMIEDIAEFVKEEPTMFYRLVIGTDSQLKGFNGNTEVDFVTAVIIHRKGKGAKYFWQKEKVFKHYHLKEKIYSETLRSLETAHLLLPLIKNVFESTHYDMEIHIDVGTKGPTREVIREVVGMVNGSGYVAKTKPDSWGASSVADKHT